MFKRRRVDIECLQKVGEVRKSISFGGADQRRAEME